MTHILSYLANHFAPEQSFKFLTKEQERLSQIHNRISDIQILAFGNSHTNSLDAEVIGDNSYIFARAGTDIFEIKSGQNYLIQKLPNLKLILVPVSYMTLYWDNSLLKDSIIRRIQFYITFPIHTPISGDFSFFFIGKIHPIFPISNIVRSDNWEKVFTNMINELCLKTTNASDSISKNSVENMKLRFNDNVEDRVTMQVKSMREVISLENDILEKTKNALIELKKNMNKKNVKVIFFTPPYSKRYTEKFAAYAPDIIESFKKTMRSLKLNNDIEYYDFSLDEDFVTDEKLFHDADHFNRIGAKKFSKKMKRIIPHLKTLAQG